MLADSNRDDLEEVKSHPANLNLDFYARSTLNHEVQVAVTEAAVRRRRHIEWIKDHWEVPLQNRVQAVQPANSREGPMHVDPRSDKDIQKHTSKSLASSDVFIYSIISNKLFIIGRAEMLFIVFMR